MQRENPKSVEPLETIEPAMNLRDDGKLIHILVKLPDIAEEKIRIDLEEHPASVTIVASGTSIQFRKVISIPCDVRVCKKRFSEGILELILEKNSPGL